MSSPITEVKPSQVVQLTAENEKLKAEIESLKRQECVNLRDTLKMKVEDEEKIEKLTEENAKLKEEIEYDNKYINIITSTLEVGMLEDVNDKIKELKKDNSRMYKACDNIHNLVGKDIVSVKKERDKYYIKSMNSSIENEKLKAENEKLKKMTDALDEQATDFCLQNKKLKEEKEKLKEKVKHLYDVLTCDEAGLGAGGRFLLNYDEQCITELKEEIEQLKFSTRANNIEAVYAGSELIDMKEFNDHLKNRHSDIYQKLYDYFDMDEHLEEEE